MAGNYKNAYATVNPNQQNIGNAIDDVENQGFRYRAEQRLVEKEQEAKKKEKQDRLDFAIANAPKFIPTGVKTIDEVNYLGLQKASDDYYKAFTEHEQLRVKDNRTPEEDKKLLQLGIKKANLFNWSENQKRLTEGMANQMKDALEGIKNGTYIPDDEILKKASDALTGYVPGTDEMGLPTIGFIDLNGDGINDVTTLADVDNMLVVKPTKMMDPYKLAQTFAKDFKLDETSTQKGYTTYDNKFVPESELKATIENLITPEALQTEAYKRGLGKNYQWSNEEVNQLKNDLMNHTNSFIGTTSKVKKDLAAEDRDAALAETKRKNRANEQIDREQEKGRNARARASNRAKYGGSGEPITADSFMFSSNLNRNTAAEKNVTPTDIPTKSKGYNIAGNKMVVSPSEGIDEVVETIWVSPDKADVWVQGFRYENQGKDKAPKKTPFLYNTKKESNKAGKFIGEIENGNGDSYNTWPEFIQDLDKETGTGFDWSNQ